MSEIPIWEKERIWFCSQYCKELFLKEHPSVRIGWEELITEWSQCEQCGREDFCIICMPSKKEDINRPEANASKILNKNKKLTRLCKELVESNLLDEDSKERIINEGIKGDIPIEVFDSIECPHCGKSIIIPICTYCEYLNDLPYTDNEHCRTCNLFHRNFKWNGEKPDE